jgi:hypothetical protein
VFSVAQSRFTVPAQTIFFVTNAVGLTLGAVYNAKTLDLYANNAHHKMGWIFTWFALAWIILGIINTYTARFNRDTKHSDCAIFSAGTPRYQRLQCEQLLPEQRWSQDSDPHLEHNFGTCSNTRSSGTESESKPNDHAHAMYNCNDQEEEEASPSKLCGLLNIARVERFLSKNFHRASFKRILIISKIIYIIFERLFIILAFTVLTTGIVTYGGIFVSLSKCK